MKYMMSIRLGAYRQKLSLFLFLRLDCTYLGHAGVRQYQIIIIVYVYCILHLSSCISSVICVSIILCCVDIL